jgi:hypothetical protein
VVEPTMLYGLSMMTKVWNVHGMLDKNPMSDVINLWLQWIPWTVASVLMNDAI